jgi:hypothetical protein
MQRLTARFLLLFALVGTFVPLALAATTAPPHACCIRKAAHQCHGSFGDLDERTVRSSSCCSHDCCRGVTTSQAGHPQPRLASDFAQNIGARVIDLKVQAPATELLASQSTRAPPHASI